MGFDDDPYWSTKKNTDNENLKTVVKRSIPDSAEVMGRIEKLPRAPLPSPLLMEWLEKQKEEESKNS